MLQKNNNNNSRNAVADQNYKTEDNAAAERKKKLMIRFDSIDDQLNDMPMNDLFSMSLKRFGIPKLDSQKSMAGRLNSLNSRDFNAYLTKIAWP